jgi:hypothetical protein
MYEVARNSSDWFGTKLTVEDTHHISLHDIEKERHEGLISEDMIQQEYYCFPPNAPVITVNGLRDISSIRPDDLVLSHLGRFRKVLGCIERNYKGKMIVIKSYGSAQEIICTPDHPIQVYHQSSQTYEWKKAININPDIDKLVFPKLSACEFKVISQELCLLIAWFITEGSTFKNGVQFSVGKIEESDRVRLLLTLLGFESSIFKSKETEHCFNVVVYSVALADFLKTSCGTDAANKRIPFHLIGGYKEQFFDELVKGDGCINTCKGYTKISYTTISKTLAYQFQLLANSLDRGYAAGISYRTGGTSSIRSRIINTSDSYQVNISLPPLRSKNTRHEWIIRTKYGRAAKIKYISSVDYDGPVYNLKVQYDETYTVAGRNVHNCSFELGVEGSYYQKYIDKMRLDGRISEVPYEINFPVFTAFDLGVRDSTSIIFFQVIGQTVRIIDYYENQKEGLEHYVNVLKNKGYQYAKHYAPHDIAVQEFGSGLTRYEKAAQLGLKFEMRSDRYGKKISAVPNVSIMDGIECVRSSFSKIWIDEKKCSHLISCLENYRQEYDHKAKVYKSIPLHSWASHGSDAFRYMCLSLPRTRDTKSAEELEQAYREYRYGDNYNMPAIFRDDLPKY